MEDVNEGGYIIGVDCAVDGDDDGKGPTLEAAIVDGYKQARKRHGDGPLTLRVVELFVSGSNPISDYRVVLKVES